MRITSGTPRQITRHVNNSIIPPRRILGLYKAESLPRQGSHYILSLIIKLARNQGGSLPMAFTIGRVELYKASEDRKFYYLSISNSIAISIEN